MQPGILAPDKSSRLHRRQPNKPDGETTILCVGDSVPLGELLLRIRARQVTLEPVLADAMRCCLEGKVARLVVDLTASGPQAFSALCHLRLLRPELNIVLVNWEEPDALDGTAFQGLPVVSIRRRLLPLEEPVTGRRERDVPRG